MISLGKIKIHLNSFFGPLSTHTHTLTLMSKIYAYSISSPALHLIASKSFPCNCFIFAWISFLLVHRKYLNMTTCSVFVVAAVDVKESKVKPDSLSLSEISLSKVFLFKIVWPKEKWWTFDGNGSGGDQLPVHLTLCIFSHLPAFGRCSSFFRVLILLLIFCF